jgi:hypothetical protein
MIAFSYRRETDYSIVETSEDAARLAPSRYESPVKLAQGDSD